MRLTIADVDRYGPLTSCHPPCDGGVTVIKGPNESGKTLYLEGLLQLLDPKVRQHMDPGPRVDESPSGRVVLETADGRHTLGNGTSLRDITSIDPIHLHNLFVVRDSDLRLPDGPDYYTKLVDHLGDVHTVEIEGLRSELVDLGRLTPGHLNLSGGAEHGDPKAVRSKAQSLVKDIDAELADLFVDEIQSQKERRLRAKKELQGVRQQLKVQRQGEELAALRDAKDALESYTEATEELATLEVFDSDQLDDLRVSESTIDHQKKEIQNEKTELKSKQRELEELESHLESERDRLHRLQNREGRIDALESSVQDYREAISADSTSDSQRRGYRYLYSGGLIGGGIAAAGGAIGGSVLAFIFAVILLGIGLVAWYQHRRLTKRESTIEQQRQKLLQEAGDAGLEVEKVDEIGATISEFREDLGAASRNVDEIGSSLESTKGRIEELEKTINERKADLNEAQRRIDEILESAEVKSIDAYESHLESVGDYERDRDVAASKLERELGEPEVEDHESRKKWWLEVIKTRKADIQDGDVSADDHDPAVLEDLIAREKELATEIDRLESELEEFDDRLDEFERRARTLGAGPFVDHPPSLETKTPAGLDSLVDDLEALISTINRDSELSRKAIDILDTMAQEEERKVTSLFDPNGPASKWFEQITAGKYNAVNYDPAAGHLTVTRDDGMALTPRELSQGTSDQLYLSARLSLASQLLGQETGFLLLDDALIGADSQRLRAGFETLSTLADDGWQIIYLTAKEEVGQGVCEEFGLDRYELTPLDS